MKFSSIASFHESVSVGNFLCEVKTCWRAGILKSVRFTGLQMMLMCSKAADPVLLSVRGQEKELPPALQWSWGTKRQRLRRAADSFLRGPVTKRRVSGFQCTRSLSLLSPLFSISACTGLSQHGGRCALSPSHLHLSLDTFRQSFSSIGVRLCQSRPVHRVGGATYRPSQSFSKVCGCVQLAKITGNVEVKRESKGVKVVSVRREMCG